MILDAAIDLLVVVLDPEGRIVHFNKLCQQLTGYSPEEVQGRLAWDFLSASEEVAAVKATFKEVRGGKASKSENHWITKDGRRLLIDWSISAAMSSAGSVKSVICTGIDRTDRAEAQERAQESEATVRALLETAAEAIVATNQEGRIVLVNAAAEKMFGYCRQKLIGQSVDQFVPERLRQRHATHRASWFAQPRNRPMGGDLELTGLRKDGTEFPIEVSLSYLHNRQGMLGVSFISDITERRKNQETLLQYQGQLRRLTASLLSAQETENRELARELHDVFSQELAALSMELSTLLGCGGVAGPLSEHLAHMERKIGNLADEMHRASRQLHPGIIEELGLPAALRELCDDFSQKSGIPVRFISESPPASLPEDISLCLYRIAQGSLRNVGKHSRATEVSVRLAGGPYSVILRVEDTGDGFDLDEGRKSGGLGLISMEERARLVNGELTIRSQPRGGTTVQVSVPVNKSSS